MTYKPVREFSGAAGQPSKDAMGPEALCRDLDKVMKMFNPDATHDNGEKGGIGKGNLNFNFGEDGTGGGGSMAEEIGSKEISELKDPSSPSNPALTVWKQIKAIVLLIVAHFNNTNNPHSVTKTQVGLGNVSNNLQATKVEFDAHINNKENPHAVTKSQVGLGNVDNTSDIDKPISTATQNALNGKVDKVPGKGLSTYDYDDTEKGKVAANTEARHSHLNKGLLDTYTQTNADLASAVANRHTHSNKSVLDGIVEVTQTLGNAADKVPSEKAVADAMAAVGMGDMMKAVYDQNNNGIVDNAEKVNGHTVESDVPAGAVFTDTVTPVIDSLDSDSSTSALSAKQGKALADLIGTKLDKTTSPNKNLLHNWDFRNPVNQRGQSSYTGTGYGTIDRWKVVGTATVSVTPDGVSFTPVTNSNLRQAIEGTSLAGKTVTMSVIFTSVSGTAAIIARDGSTVISSITTTSAGLVTNTFKVPENLSSLSVEINAGLGSSFVAQSAKLELGSTSTLANDPPADYGEQLALCQRYCIELCNSKTQIHQRVGWAMAQSTTIAIAMIPLPVTPRNIIPTVITTATNWYLRKGSNFMPITSIIGEYPANNMACLNITAEGLTLGEWYMLTNGTSASDISLLLSWEL